MADTRGTAPPPVRYTAQDIRRVPMLGIALGMGLTAAGLQWIESGPFNTGVVLLLWAGALVCVLAVLPIANTLSLDDRGFRIRSLAVFSRFVPWSQVVAIEAGEGWAGSSIILELAEPADRGFILGLPRDPTLGRRSLVDGYGLDPEELAATMRRHRAAAHP